MKLDQDNTNDEFISFEEALIAEASTEELIKHARDHYERLSKIAAYHNSTINLALDALLDIEKFVDALIWCSGSSSFAPEGEAFVGWNKVCRPLIDKWNRVK